MSHYYAPASEESMSHYYTPASEESMSHFVGSM